MTIESALLSVYPNHIVSESVRLGTKLYLTMDNNAMARDETGYWVARDNGPLIFKFDTKGVVRVYKDVTLTPHEKRIIRKIIHMWRGTYRPDWQTFESMRAHPTTSFADTMPVPVLHDTL